MMNEAGLMKNKYNNGQEVFDDDDDEDIIDENENILINNNLNNELIFSNIQSSQLNISDQQLEPSSPLQQHHQHNIQQHKQKLSQTINSCADSASSTSSLSSSSLADITLNNSNFNLNSNNSDQALKIDEFEILRSIQNLMYKYKWSTKIIGSDQLSILIECQSCDFSLNISTLIKKFRSKLDDYNITQASLSSSSPPTSSLKFTNDLINCYLIKLINAIFVRHECKNNDTVQLIIKNFFRQFNKIETDLNDDYTDQASMHTLNLKSSPLNKLKRQLSNYLSTMIDIFNRIDFDSDEKIYNSNQDVVDCSLNEDETLLVGLEGLNDFDLNNNKNNKQIESNLDDENLVLTSDNQLNYNTKVNSINMSSYDNSVSCDDNSSILKAINKRKLHLSCPICNSSVVNMSDHLVKKHSIRDRNQRKYIMDIVRKNYINDSKVNTSNRETNLNSSKQYQSKLSNTDNNNNNTNSRQVFASKNYLDRDLETTSTRKFIKCPICLDDNKYFVNISDHLIKIHHLVTSETRKPILKQIKEKSLNFSLKPSSETLSRDQNFSIDTKSIQDNSNRHSVYPDFSYAKNVFNEKIDNDPDQLNINDIFISQNQNEQLIEQNLTNQSKSMSKRKPLKSKRFSGSNIQLFENDLDDDDLVHTDSSSSLIQDKSANKDDEEDENFKNGIAGCGGDDDSDYSGLIGFNYDTLKQNCVKNNVDTQQDFIQNVDFMTNNPKEYQINENIDNFKKRKTSDSIYQDNLNNSIHFDDNQVNLNSDELMSIPNKLKKIKYFNGSFNLLKTQLSNSNDFLTINENGDNYHGNNNIDNRYDHNHQLTNNRINVQQQINKSSIMSPEANTIYSLNSLPSRGVSNTDNLDKLNFSSTNVTTNNLNQIWTKLNNIESSIMKTYKNFEMFTDNLSKHIQLFKNQFQATLSDIDSLKRTLLDATNSSEMTEDLANKEQPLLIDSKKVIMKKNI